MIDSADEIKHEEQVNLKEIASPSSEEEQEMIRRVIESETIKAASKTLRDIDGRSV